MPRHSKNSQDRSYHTFSERSKSSAINKWGTQRARLGRDSQLPFGYCSLTLTATDDPVASPSGHVYDRQAIYSYMLEKIQEAKLLGVEEPEDAVVAAQQKRSSSLAITDKSTTAATKSAVAAAGSSSSSSSSTAVVLATESRVRGREEAALDGEDNHDDKEDKTEEETNDNSDEVKRARVDSNNNSMPAPLDDELPVSESGTGSKNKTREARLQDTSFWLPQGTPQHIAKAKKAKSARPLSPFSGDPLRRKDLTSVKFQRAPGSEGGNSGNATYLCCVSGEELHHQETVVLKPSGCVLSLDSFKRAVEPSKPMMCPITSKRLKPKDVLLLARSASGFSSAGAVEAKTWRPSH